MRVAESPSKVACPTDGLTVVSVTPLALKLTVNPGVMKSSRVGFPF
jgi:hypothetical protein